MLLPLLLLLQEIKTTLGKWRCEIILMKMRRTGGEEEQRKTRNDAIALLRHVEFRLMVRFKRCVNGITAQKMMSERGAEARSCFSK